MSVRDRIGELNKFGSILGLERIRELLRRLGNPQDGMRVIHVAGTNGKGSVCRYLECGLSECGYKVGLYTSPYIERFNERIRLNEADISDDELEYYGNRVLKNVDAMLAEGFDSPTEFEAITAIAFLYFKEKAADIVILEVGLGGRGDSTNIVEHPLVSVITFIGYDHMDRLGDTLERIAGEKAGIIKPGSPVVSNVPEREPAVVIARKAYEAGSRLYDVSRVRYEITQDTARSQRVTMELYETDYSAVEISMVGKHQAENLKTALAVIEVLRRAREIKVQKEPLFRGLKRAVQPGRFEIVSDEPTIILDGAHNEAGSAALRDTVRRYFPERRVILVMGVLADKQVDEMIVDLLDIAGELIATEPDSPRALSAEELSVHIERYGADVFTVKSPADSINVARNMASDEDVILFAGSLYLIGEIRRLLKNA